MRKRKLIKQTGHWMARQTLGELYEHPPSDIDYDLGLFDQLSVNLKVQVRKELKYGEHDV